MTTLPALKNDKIPKKSQQGILSLQYDSIYLATTFILYSKSHFCEMNITLIYQDLGLQLLWGRLHLHSRGCSLLPLIFPWNKRCLLSLSPPTSSKDSLGTCWSFLKAQNTLGPGKLSNKWTCLDLVKRWLEFVWLVPPAGPRRIVHGCKITHCMHSH